jgi:hypothetical protein
MNYGGGYRDLLYRPEVDKSRYETLPYDPSTPPRYEKLPYYPESDKQRRSEAAADLLGRAFLEQFLQQNPGVIDVAASPSFETPVDIDSPVIDRDIERHRQMYGRKPVDMDALYRNIQRVRQMIQGV